MQPKRPRGGQGETPQALYDPSCHKTGGSTTSGESTSTLYCHHMTHVGRFLVIGVLDRFFWDFVYNYFVSRYLIFFTSILYAGGPKKF